jgi:hypothetical protein
MATTLSVTVATDVTERVAKLGLQSELAVMIERTLQTVPDLHGVRVTLEYDPVYPARDPMIVLWALRDELSVAAPDDAGWQWGAWKVATFPHEVSRRFAMLCVQNGARSLAAHH